MLTRLGQRSREAREDPGRWDELDYDYDYDNEKDNDNDNGDENENGAEGGLDHYPGQPVGRRA